MTTDKAPELLPCPFCGSVEARSASDGWGNTYYKCLECKARGPSRFMKEPDPVAWNTRADLAPDPLGAVKVKPLVWDCHPDASHDPKCNEHYGGGQENLVGVNEYNIYPHPCAIGMFVLDVMGNRCEEDFPSVEAAKAAAQADYEARIRSALEPDPQDVKVAGLLQAADIAGAVMQKYAKAHYSGEVVKVYKNGDDTLSESAAKAYCAGEILEAIRAARASITDRGEPT